MCEPSFEQILYYRTHTTEIPYGVKLAMTKDRTLNIQPIGYHISMFLALVYQTRSQNREFDPWRAKFSRLSYFHVQGANLLKSGPRHVSHKCDVQYVVTAFRLLTIFHDDYCLPLCTSYKWLRWTENIRQRTNRKHLSASPRSPAVV